MVCKCLATGAGGFDPGPRFSILVPLLDADIPGFLQHAQMSAQVAVRQVECLLEKAEVCLIRLSEYGEYPQSDSLMNRVVEQLRGMANCQRLPWTIIPAAMPATAALNDIANNG